MKKASSPEPDDDLRPEYDFSSLRGGVRGKYYERYRAGVNLALLEPELAKAFPTKITAWLDRKHTDPGRDAGDLFLFLRHYMDLGNFDRAAAEHADLFEVDDFDYVEAGTKLLARDMASLLESSGTELLLSILRPEAGEDGALLLASQSGLKLERAHRLLQVLCAELARTRG